MGTLFRVLSPTRSRPALCLPAAFRRPRDKTLEILSQAWDKITAAGDKIRPSRDGGCSTLDARSGGAGCRVRPLGAGSRRIAKERRDCVQEYSRCGGRKQEAGCGSQLSAVSQFAVGKYEGQGEERSWEDDE
jgi:hypothetical protein